MEFKKEKLGVRKSYRFNDNQNLDKMLHVHKTSVPLKREKHSSYGQSVSALLWGKLHLPSWVWFYLPVDREYAEFNMLSLEQTWQSITVRFEEWRLTMRHRRVDGTCCSMQVAFN
ncbi:hypothetical protein IMY05_006G0222800 [Salix suchowensis]|nr:hypothetical protein IMY05_006G0222800 [Salix suchowensis]